MESFSVTPFGGPIPPDVLQRLSLWLHGSGFLGKSPILPEHLLWALNVGDVMLWVVEEQGSGSWRARVLRGDETLPQPDMLNTRIFLRRSNGFFELY